VTAESLRIPPDKRGKKRNKPYLTPQQFDLLAELIPEPYASMVYVAIYKGLRVSELAGLRWNDIGASSITIDERFCRGDWGAPKSEASNATIGVNGCVVDRIHRLKGLTVEVRDGNAIRKYKVVKSDGPDDLVFQGVQSGGPLRDNNILVRFIKPAVRSMDLPWVNWRSLRTSHATWLNMASTDVKDAQAQMRHSRSNTTLDIYRQFVPESQQRAVDRLSRLVN
jgi:integrase